MTLKILFLASEAEPFVKIGGLGDVAGSLPQALKSLSTPEAPVDIRVVIPYHGSIREKSLPIRHLTDLSIPHYAGDLTAQVYETESGGIPVYLIAGALIPPDAPVYSTNPRSDGLKYTFVSLTALSLAEGISWVPDILHANDWHTSPALYALKIRKSPTWKKTATLLSIHNLPYLGHGTTEALSEFHLPPAVDSLLPAWSQHLPFPLGLLSADHLVAVSPTYAQEILTPDFGAGLNDFLTTRKADISGILNGINTLQWDPSVDSALTANFSNIKIVKRKENKTALLEELGLEQGLSGFHPAEIPLLGMITRMDYQKGVDLIPPALHILKDQPWQIIILGTGSPDLEDAVRRLAGEFPKNVRVVLRYDPILSRRIYAGADAILIPSRYEPCGLVQMIAMRYGCVPIARSTGGLRDTIQDKENEKLSNGFLFNNATPEDLASAIKRAITAYQDRTIWKKLQEQGMQLDFSWQRSAQQYLDLYTKLSSNKVSPEVREKGKPKK